jgi:hypothetical protein
MSLLLLLRGSAAGPTWKYWNGSVESTIALQGEWNGSTVTALTSTIVVV